MLQQAPTGLLIRAGTREFGLAFGSLLHPANFLPYELMLLFCPVTLVAHFPSYAECSGQPDNAGSVENYVHVWGTNYLLNDAPNK